MSTQYSLATLFGKYHHELKVYVTRTFDKANDAEDIVQDTFHKMLHLDDIEGVRNPRAYLYKTARNLALNTIRSEKRNAHYVDSLPETEDVSIPIFRQICASQDLDRINSALRKLSSNHRETFILSRVKGMSYSEIAKQKNISVSTVEKHIVKVLKFLRVELHDSEEL